MIRKYIGLYEKIPLGYVPAWEDWHRKRAVCYPIGLHWLMRWMRSFWHWTLGPTARDRREYQIHQKGYDAGFQAGVVSGEEEGQRKACESNKAMLQELMVMRETMRESAPHLKFDD